jgi:hypothetical protein
VRVLCKRPGAECETGGRREISPGGYPQLAGILWAALAWTNPARSRNGPDAVAGEDAMLDPV